MLPEGALLESVAARPGYDLCVSTPSSDVALLGPAVGAIVCINTQRLWAKYFVYSGQCQAEGKT